MLGCVSRFLSGESLDLVCAHPMLSLRLLLGASAPSWRGQYVLPRQVAKKAWRWGGERNSSVASESVAVSVPLAIHIAHYLRETKGPGSINLPLRWLDSFVSCCALHVVRHTQQREAQITKPGNEAVQRRLIDTARMQRRILAIV